MMAGTSDLGIGSASTPNKLPTGETSMMNPIDFADHLRRMVDDAAADEAQVLTGPPGRSPDKPLVERSEWFLGLDALGQGMALEMVRGGAFAAMFGVCCELDGVRPIDNDGGSLRLTYVGRDGTETLINDIDVVELHGELRGPGSPP